MDWLCDCLVDCACIFDLNNGIRAKAKDFPWAWRWARSMIKIGFNSGEKIVLISWFRHIVDRSFDQGWKKSHTETNSSKVGHSKGNLLQTFGKKTRRFPSFGPREDRGFGIVTGSAHCYLLSSTVILCFDRRSYSQVACWQGSHPRCSRRLSSIAAPHRPSPLLPFATCPTVVAKEKDKKATPFSLCCRKQNREEWDDLAGPVPSQVRPALSKEVQQHSEVLGQVKSRSGLTWPSPYRRSPAVRSTAEVV